MTASKLRILSRHREHMGAAVRRLLALQPVINRADFVLDGTVNVG